MDADSRLPGFACDRLWSRGGRGHTLVAGAPTTFFRVTDPGARILDALERGEPLPVGHDALTTRLSRAGAIHPVPRRAADIDAVSVVIPAWVGSTGNLTRLVGLVDSLAPLRVIVVDDCSPVDPAGALRSSPAHVIRLEENRGPAAARNAGLAHVTTPIVVFVDLDVRVGIDPILLLAGLVLDGHASLVAPRVGSGSVLGVGMSAAIVGYETHRSPLDMGPDPAVVRPGGRVAYVPSALIACDTRAVRSIGGFDEQMRTGEDVDLVWRLVDTGATCRYVPSLLAEHLPRATVGALIRQRIGYGRSAASLAKRHGNRAAPFRSHPIVAVPAALALCAYPFAAVVAGLLALAWLSLSLRFARLGRRGTVRLSARVVRSVVTMTARAVRREWWPIVAGIAIVSDRAAFALVVSFLVPLLVHLVRTRPRRPFATILLTIIDDTSYGLGVWIGAFGRRTPKVLLPVFTLRTNLRSREN